MELQLQTDLYKLLQIELLQLHAVYISWSCETSCSGLDLELVVSLHYS